jgi:hypothetical protein
MEKLPREKVEEQLAALGVPPATVDGERRRGRARRPDAFVCRPLALMNRVQVFLVCRKTYICQTNPRNRRPFSGILGALAVKSLDELQVGGFRGDSPRQPTPTRPPSVAPHCPNQPTQPTQPPSPNRHPSPVQKALLGSDASEALGDLQRLWALAEGYGFAEWLVFDASVIRGLAYYTGGF